MSETCRQAIEHQEMQLLAAERSLRNSPLSGALMVAGALILLLLIAGSLIAYQRRLAQIADHRRHLAEQEVILLGHELALCTHQVAECDEEGTTSKTALSPGGSP